MKNYCIVGTGNRGIGMFGLAIVEKYSEHAKITGLCDNNCGRLKYAQERLGKEIPVYTDFERMLDEVPCDVVIVCSQDNTHNEYIVKALKAGKDVITEKPMTTDDEKCRQILIAERESGRKVHVTFNYRFAPYVAKIKELLDSGVIGRIHSVEFQWCLDTVHGADYYRRWHRRKENSGGLFVHKSTHHFDLINWWIGQDPVQVYACGSRNFYGDKGTVRGERCLGCQHSRQCEFYMEIKNDPWLRDIYLQNEKDDGYYRDRCVFDAEIDIEDTMSAIVQYTGGIQLTYNLVSFVPFEGWRAVINGSKGRMEAFLAEAFVSKHTPDYAQRESVKNRKSIDWRIGCGNDSDVELHSDEVRIYPLYGGVQSIKVDRAAGGHGGGDDRLRDLLFLPDAVDEKGMMAGSRAGAMSILIGVAANYSMAGNTPIRIADLLKNT
jgi:Predicted dehydrogenases and related proteins